MQEITQIVGHWLKQFLVGFWRNLLWWNPMQLLRICLLYAMVFGLTVTAYHLYSHVP